MTMTKKNTAGLAAAAAKTAALTNANGGTPAKHLLRTSLLVAALGLASVASAQGISGIGAFVPNTELGFTPVAKAGEPRINWINGEYQESNTDLSVKVLGGSLDIARSWSQGRWWLNPAWAPLSFELDPLGSNAKVIERVGVLYERSGQSDLYMAKSKGNAPVYIKRLKDAAGQHTGWQWYDRFGNTINYSQDGVIQSYANASGVKVSFAYDSATSARILDHGGKTIYTVTMAGGLITRIEDLAGRSVSYQWSGQRLAQVTDVMGHAWKYEYDANGQITSRTDPLGLKITAQYIQSIPAPEPMLSLGKKGVTIDPTGTSGTTQKLANLWGGGRVGQFDGQSGCASTGANNYLRERRVFEVTYTDCRGNATVTQYDLQGNELSRTFNGKRAASNQWDGAYHQKYTNARGYSTTTTYDSNYQPLQITHPDGSVEKYTYEPVFGRQSSYTNQLGVVSTWSYDSKGNVTEWVEAKGLPEQRTTRYSYDAYSQLIKKVLSKNGDEREDTAIFSLYSYGTSGSVESITDSNGSVTHYTYDQVGNVKERIDALNRKTSYSYNDRLQIIHQYSALGNVNSIEYDAVGRVVKLVDELSNATRMNYDKYGRLISRTDKENHTTLYEYSSNGDPVKKISPEGVVEMTAFDEERRPVKKSKNENDFIKYTYGEKLGRDASLLVDVEYPGGLKSFYQYDELGRKIVSVIQNADGEKLRYVTTYDALGRKVSTTSPSGKTDYISYDALNRIVTKTNSLGAQFRYFYDISDNKILAIDANNNEYNYKFGKTGLLDEEIRPNNFSIRYFYDKVGQLQQRIESNGNSTIMEYDFDGRLVKETKSNSAGDNEENQIIEYFHDKAGQVVKYSQKNGRNDLVSQARYTLDKQSKIIQEEISYWNGSTQIKATIAQTWNGDGQRTSRRYPDGGVATFVYDKGYLKELILPNKNEKIAWSEYEWNLPKTINYPGSERIQHYDGFYRYSTIEVKNDRSENILHLDYKYDPDGNITKISKKIISEIDGYTNFDYDKVGRLIGVRPSSSFQSLGIFPESYTYDLLGNRILGSDGSEEWSYMAGNMLSGWGEGLDKTNYSYSKSGDINEEVRAGRARSFNYDAAGRVSSVSDNGDIFVKYKYDPKGRRISKIFNSPSDSSGTYFIYGEEGLLAEMDAAGNQVKTYGWDPHSIWGTNLLWQNYHKKSDDGLNIDTQYVQNDHLGSPQVAANEKGLVTWYQLSEAFGKANILYGEANDINIRLPGQYYDKETEFHYNFHRDYNPVIGRYMQSDPIGLSGGDNLYLYASAMPIQNRDATGLSDKCCNSKSDGECCSWWLNDKRSDPAKAEIGGQVVCCQGRKVACVDEGNYVDPQEVECAYRHERKHFDDGDCSQNCEIYVLHFRRPEDQNPGECAAWGVTIKCLDENLNNCKGSIACQAKYIAKINESVEMTNKKNYGCGFSRRSLPIQ